MSKHLPANLRNLDVIVGIANPPPAKNGTFMKQADFDRFIEKVNKTKSMEDAIPVHINHVVHDAQGVPSTPVGHVIAAGIHPKKKNLVVALVLHDTPEGKLASRLIHNGEMSLNELSLGLQHLEVPQFVNKKFGPMSYAPIQSDATEISLCTKGAHEGTKFVYKTTLGDYLDGKIEMPSDKGIPSSNNINKTSPEIITTSPTETRTVETVASASVLNPYVEMTGISRFGDVKINAQFATTKLTPPMQTNMKALLEQDLTPYRNRIFEIHDKLNSMASARYTSTTASAAPSAPDMTTQQQQVSNPSKPTESQAQQPDDMENLIKEIKDKYEQLALVETKFKTQMEQPPPPVAPIDTTSTTPAAVESVPEMDITLPDYTPTNRPKEMNFEDFVRNELNMDPATLPPGARTNLENMLKQSNLAKQIPYDLELQRLKNERLEFQDLLRKNLPFLLESMKKKNMDISLDSMKKLFASVPFIDDSEAKKSFATIISTYASTVADNKQLQQQHASLNAIQRENEYKGTREAIETAKGLQDVAKNSLELLEKLRQEHKRLKSSFQEFKDKYPFGYSRDDRVVSTTASAGSSNQQPTFTFNATKNATSVGETKQNEPVNIMGTVAYLEATKLYPEAATEFPEYYEQTKKIWSDLQSLRVNRPPVHSDFKLQADRVRYDMQHFPVQAGGRFTMNPYAQPR